jgi:hypothetical protein
MKRIRIQERVKSYMNMDRNNITKGKRNTRTKIRKEIKRN